MAGCGRRDGDQDPQWRHWMPGGRLSEARAGTNGLHSTAGNKAGDERTAHPTNREPEPGNTGAAARRCPSGRPHKTRS